MKFISFITIWICFFIHSLGLHLRSPFTRRAPHQPCTRLAVSRVFSPEPKHPSTQGSSAGVTMARPFPSRVFGRINRISSCRLYTCLQGTGIDAALGILGTRRRERKGEKIRLEQDVQFSLVFFPSFPFSFSAGGKGSE